MLSECDEQMYLVGIEFKDANGRRWYRNENATLRYLGLELRKPVPHAGNS
jgi:hypothetical protein